MQRLILLLLATFIYHSAISQCNITYSGAPCVETTFQFFCNSNNGVEHYWTFNGYDSIKLSCNAEYSFNSPGKKQISLRVKDAQGNVCRDTISISIGEVVAHMLLSQSRPQCNTLVEAIDSSFISQDPYAEQDSINNWTFQWYDNISNEKIYNKTAPKKFSTFFKNNGNQCVTLKTETRLGCQNSETIYFNIPGPIPYFDTFIYNNYCINEKVGFTNMSKYNNFDSCISLWNFGDNEYASQKGDFKKTDTIWHPYKSKGQYNVNLTVYYSIYLNNNALELCSVMFPDTTGLLIDPVRLTINDCNQTEIKTQSIAKIINVYPNPASYSIQIQGLENQKIFLINSLGIIEYFFTKGANDMINIDHLPEGLYLLTDANFKVLDKVVIAR